MKPSVWRLFLLSTSNQKSQFLEIRKLCLGPTCPPSHTVLVLTLLDFLPTLLMSHVAASGNFVLGYWDCWWRHQPIPDRRHTIKYPANETCGLVQPEENQNSNHLWTEIGTSSQGWLLQGRAQLITNHDFPQGLAAALAPGLQATSRIRPHSHSSASQHATPWHRPQQRPSFTLYSQALLYGRLRVYKDAKQPVNWGLCFFSVFHKHISDLAFPHH